MSLVISITGTNGKTTTLKILERFLLDNGYTVGLVGSLGVFINGERIKKKDSSGPYSYKLLNDIDNNRGLDFILVENVLRHIKHRTFYPRKADIVLITNISKDHIHQTKTNSIEGIAQIKAKLITTLKKNGTVILNKTDKYSSQIKADYIKYKIDFFSPALDNKKYKSYLLTKNGANKANISNLSAVSKIISILKDKYKIKFGEISKYLQQYSPETIGLLGKSEIFKFDGFTVILDDAKNPAGYNSIFKFAKSFPHNRLISIPKASSTRKAEFIQELGAIAGKYSDIIYLKESLPRYSNNPKKGTIIRNLKIGALSMNFKHENVIECLDEVDALERALKKAERNDLILFLAYRTKQIRDIILKKQNI